MTTMSSNGASELQTRYEQCGQGHVFEYVKDGSLTEEEQASLFKQLETIKVEDLAHLYQAATGNASASSDDDIVQPFTGDIGQSTDEALVEECEALGLEAIRNGQVAALVLAGGQGTRLGYDGPKGMYDIGLKSGKTLFQLLTERIIKLGQLAAAATPTTTGGGDDDDTKNAARCIILFYIMTSPLNHADTKEYFEKNNYFGAEADNVVFFQQGMLPCMSLTDGGKILMETKSKVAMAPDGNGGIYPSLQASGALDDMVKRGVQYLNVFSIDNALVKPADPAFVGYGIRQKADCGNKSVWKAHAHEKVGVVASRGGRPCIVEYSEITKEMAEQTTDQKSGECRLVFGAGNICNHFYTIDFLCNEIIPNLSNLYHVAHKKIPVYDKVQNKTVTPDSAPNGIKLEAFIFDVFPMSKNMAIWEVERSQEFAPVKNAAGSTSDSPDTARAMISKLAEDWVKKAGAIVITACDDGGGGDSCSNTMYPCEVSPLTSYAGEGLESYKDQQLIFPFSI